MSGDGIGAGELPPVAGVTDAAWAAMDRAGLSVAVADLDGRCVRVTETLAATFGGKPSDIIGVPYQAVVDERDVPAVNEVMARLARGPADPVELTVHLPGLDGSLITARVNIVPVAAGPSATAGVLVTVANVAEIAAAQQALASSEVHARALIEALSVGVLLFDVEPDGRIVARLSNQAARDLLCGGTGIDEPPLDERGYVDADGSPITYDDLPAAVAARTGRPVIRHTWGRLLPDGTVRWLRETSRPWGGPDGRVRQVVTSITDVTAEEAAHREIIAAHARFEALIEHGSDSITVLDRHGTLLYASPAFEDLFGRPPHASLGMKLYELVHPDDRPHVQGLFARLLGEPGRVISFECRVIHADGTWRHVEATSTNRLEDPAVGGIVANTRDVTERVRTAARLSHLALHDDLTDLPNRALLLDRLDQALVRAGRTGQPCAVLYMDLDHFKTINDSLGHAAGDRVLQVVADRLRRVVRPGDSIARLSGDEFVVLAEGIATPEVAVSMAQRIHEVVTAPVQLTERSVTPGCSLGIVVSTEGPSDVLLQQADTALYRAKAGGRGRWALYSAAMGSMARRRLDTEDLIRAALAADRLLAVYQPIVDLDTGSVMATEALARIRRSDGTLVEPREFIPVAEDSGLILAVGARILGVACAQQRLWSAGDWLPVERVSVNLSARQLASPSLVREVEAALEDHDLPASQLCLELTESALIDAGGSSRRNIVALSRTGVGLAIDDFGTGWSSLAYVRRFQVDTLKLDRSLVTALGRDADATAVVEAVVGLGRSLGLCTVAEGVATAEQANMLRNLGCDAGQGSLFGRPQLADRLTESWLAGAHVGSDGTAGRARQAQLVPRRGSRADAAPGR